MNPRFQQLLTIIITMLVSSFLADRAHLSPDQVDTIAGAATILASAGLGFWHQKHEGWSLRRRRFQPGEEVVEGGQTWVCKE